MPRVTLPCDITLSRVQLIGNTLLSLYTAGVINIDDAEALQQLLAYPLAVTIMELCAQEKPSECIRPAALANAVFDALRPSYQFKNTRKLSYYIVRYLVKSGLVEQHEDCLVLTRRGHIAALTVMTLIEPKYLQKLTGGGHR